MGIAKCHYPLFRIKKPPDKKSSDKKCNRNGVFITANKGVLRRNYEVLCVHYSTTISLKYYK
jgi:hypothetical protein